ncbi:hypothetical protein GCM10010169_52960 [Micromonospora fulviviridis]|nr:hypothetical protein GCM10010169_52960 [Micromonospora fulviviridis]
MPGRPDTRPTRYLADRQPAASGARPPACLGTMCRNVVGKVASTARPAGALRGDMTVSGDLRLRVPQFLASSGSNPRRSRSSKGPRDRRDLDGGKSRQLPHAP